MTIELSEGRLHSAMTQPGSDAAAASTREECGEQALRTKLKLNDPVKREALKMQTNPLFSISVAKDAEDPMLAEFAHLQLLKAETQSFLEQVQREAAAATKWNSEIPEDGARSPKPSCTINYPAPPNGRDLYGCMDELARLCLGLHGAVESLRTVILNAGISVVEPQVAPLNLPPAFCKDGGDRHFSSAPNSPLSFGSSPSSPPPLQASHRMPASSPPGSQCAPFSGESSPLRKPSPPRMAQRLQPAPSTRQPQTPPQHQPMFSRSSVPHNPSNLGPGSSLRRMQPDKAASSCSSSRRSSMCKYETGAGLRACVSEADFGNRDLWLDVPSPTQQLWPDALSPKQQQQHQRQLEAGQSTSSSRSPGGGRSPVTASTTAVLFEKIPGTATQLARLRANLESMRRERAVSEGAARRPLPKRNITSVSLYDQMPRSPKPASNRRATYQGPDSDNEEGAEEQDPLGVLHLPNPRFTSTSKWATADMRVSEKCRRPL